MNTIDMIECHICLNILIIRFNFKQIKIIHPVFSSATVGTCADSVMTVKGVDPISIKSASVLLTQGRRSNFFVEGGGKFSDT